MADAEDSIAQADAEAALREWKRVVDTRDQVVLDAHAAGININRIHTITEISRSTIYRILGRSSGDDHRASSSCGPDDPM